jgi:hypothetical protein
VAEPDGQIAQIFAHSHRISKKEITAVASHKVKVFVSGPGGSVESARAIVQAAAALVRAGGLGVMVDNSGNTHSPRDWLALAGDKQPGGLYWAYVGAAGGENEVWSVGMHCLGLRDAEIRGIPDRNFAGFLLHNFLGYTYQSGKVVNDGDMIGGGDGPTFRARHQPFTRVP